MRLTIINQFYAPDLAPTGHMAASLAEHRASLGDQVSVITSAGGYVSRPRPQTPRAGGNPRVFRLWTPRAGKRSTLARLADYASFYTLAGLRALALPRQDVIVSLTTPPFIAWTAVLHRLLHRSTAIVLWNMDCYPEIAERTGVIRPGGGLSRFLRWLNRRLFRRLDAVVCLDQAMHDLLRASYAPEGQGPSWHVIPNWEPASQFPAGAKQPAWEGMGSLGPGDHFIVLYLGNAGFGHDFESVIAAAERLADEPVSWVFVGGGDKYGWLEGQIRDRHLTSVHLFPYVPKVETPSIMAGAGCALITMNHNAMGVISPSKLHGSLAMGLPILYVGPPGGNVDDAVRRFDVGVSLRHADVDGIVAFVRRLASDPEARAAYGRSARAAFEQAYCDAKTLPQFDRVIAAARHTSDAPPAASS